MATRFGAREAARLENIYASPAIATQRARTRAALGAQRGERGLDVGCGPGFLACELAQEVGPAGRVIGLDESPEMLEAARARIVREGLEDRMQVRPGDAARLDFPAASFDFVTAVQVYLYVADVAAALAEAARVLRPGGRLAVVDTDWDSCVWLTADRDRHRRVMEGRVAVFAQAHLPPRLPALLAGAGLRLDHAEAIPVLELRGGPDSFSGGLIAPMADQAVRHGLPREEADAWKADLLARAGSEGEYFFSLTRYLFVATRAAS
jgi:SAM-dependent methyltransferase